MRADSLFSVSGQREIGPFRKFLAYPIFNELRGQTNSCVAQARDKDDKVCLAANLIERVQRQHTVNYQGALPVDAASNNALQICRPPLYGLPVSEIQIELNGRHSELPCQPRRKRRFADTVRAVDSDQ